MRLILPIAGFFIGCMCGTAMFYAADTLAASMFAASSESRTTTRWVRTYWHAGTVVSHDRQNRTIALQEPSSFGSEPVTTRFTYDDETVWSSVEYIFRDGIHDRRTLNEHEHEQLLTEGALVVLAHDPETTHPWRIAQIAFLRRSDL